MTVKLSSVAVDLTKEREGDWVPFPEWPGVEFKVRSVESPSFKEARDGLLRRMAKRHGDKPIPQDELTKSLGSLYAKELLLDWRGFDTPYDAGEAEAMLSDPAYRNVANAVAWCAARVGAIDVEYVEDAAKN